MKYYLGLFALLLTMSCQTMRTSTSTALNVDTDLNSKTTADLVVSPNKIHFDYKPTKSERKAGFNVVINNATAAALKANGDADVLVARQYEAVYKQRMFGKKMKSIRITGYPASYKNFRKVESEK